MPQGLSTPAKMQYLITGLADTSLPADAKLRLKKRLRRLEKLRKKHGARFDSKKLVLGARLVLAYQATMNYNPLLQKQLTPQVPCTPRLLTQTIHFHALTCALDARTSCAHFKPQFWVCAKCFFLLFR
jgi:hypothetical protein